MYRVSNRSQLIYILILTFISSALLILPFVYVTISVTSPGIIQSEKERIDLLAPVSGQVSNYKMFDNKRIETGDTMIVIDSSIPQEQLLVMERKKKQLEGFISDANILLNTIKLNRLNKTEPQLSSNKYMASWQQLLQETTSTSNNNSQLTRDFDRAKKLYTHNYITASEFEKAKLELDQAVSEHYLILRKYRVQWETDIIQQTNDLKDINTNILELKVKKQQYLLKASVKGTLQNLTGMQVGTYVFINQKLAEISPEGSLYAFCYVQPKDIGLIKKDQLTNFQIDAFNYNQWGSISGRVIDISDDIIQIGDKPYFKVKCKLGNTFLKLRNGHTENIKKGMSFSARFFVAKKTLFQLLFNNVDDWANPSVTKQND